MDISKLKRNPSKIHDSILETQDGALITKTGCYILFPEDYIKKGLAIIGNEVSALGIYAIFIDDVTYALSTATSMTILGDGLIENVEVSGMNFVKVTFGPGDVFMKSTHLIISNKLVNTVMDFFMDQGKVPFYITARDMADMFIDSTYWNKVHFGGSQMVRDILASTITRSLDDVRVPYRLTATPKTLNDRPRFIPLNDVGLNVTSNIARVCGPQLLRATRAALLEKRTTATDLEELYNE